ncbi:MAG: hypothetical protein A2271_00490 [Candidatus Moranbacteria bacterium RIFOXYA12_FULL_35_19]|nr:MAG: hypothetical protein UR78_C0009G0051 [Candidatus Moranbacteria bacterium GW2011_GWF2_35_39]OGI32740.1 MAG: hypothetical protein A2489_02385 [Candidatus Moranbacteria bacterium RIFOXYC12_FULL_36_13]OGI35195.1 MAG: hypothetical protein A2271_00490 [Candidatus Moranbacteria bacterium RIFOXYA12_FULL_35_19]
MFGEWLIYAVASIVCWGLINVLDSYFVESKIYKNMFDGMIVSSLYKVWGVALVGGIFFTKVLEISLINALLAMLGGALISMAFLSYFAAMLYNNDSPLVQLAWNLSSPLVVVLGYVFLKEEFSIKAYVGMGIIFLGAFVISFSKDSFKGKFSKLMLLLVPLVVLYSTSEVLMKYIEEVRNVEFEQSFPFLCLGQVLFGSIILIIRRKSIENIGKIIKKNWALFFSSEALELLGLFLMQLGIAKAPSISLFGVVEAFMPAMVILLTGVSIFLLKIFKRGDTLKKIYEENMLSGIRAKIIATAIMMVGVYLI